MTEHNNVTISRELLRQVLDALQAHSHPRFLPDDFAEAITALRNALEQSAPAQCKHCTKFFSKYRCNASQGECDCPKCQGFCTCLQQPEVAK